jgi:hypothetical protein
MYLSHPKICEKTFGEGNDTVSCFAEKGSFMKIKFSGIS